MKKCTTCGRYSVSAARRSFGFWGLMMVLCSECFVDAERAERKDKAEALDFATVTVADAARLIRREPARLPQSNLGRAWSF